MNDERPIESEPPESEPESVWRSVRQSGSQSAALLIGLAGLETLFRTVLGTASFPDVGSALWELWTRTARLLTLAPALMLFDLLLVAAGRAPRVREHVAPLAARWLATLCAPLVLLRAAATYGIVTLVLARTVGRQYQLHWHSGATFACAALPLHFAFELAWARARKHTPPSNPNPWGRVGWLLTIAAACCVLATVMGKPVAGAIAALAAMAVVAHGDGWARRLPARGLWGVAAFAAVGLWQDTSRATLRRFSSNHTPFGNLSLLALGRLTDLDGDGASAMFGLDCDDFDPTRSPALVDLPDDEVDQNCSGRDGSLEETMQQVGPTSPRAQRARSEPRSPMPAVVLITVDGLRHDVFQDASVLPQTRAWAEQCHRFTNARSQSNGTGDSLVSLHTGMYPRHVEDGDEILVAYADPKRKVLSTPPTLAAMLAAAGFATYVVFPAFPLENLYFLTGYELGRTLPDTGDASWPGVEATLAQARAYLREAPADRPLHLRIHVMDLHVPYRGGAGRAGYLRTAHAIDGELARFLRELPANAVVILTADHGEAFGEHGTITHGSNLFDEQIHVPLVLCAPAELGLGAPRETAGLVGLVDIVPTLVELLGLPYTYAWHGQSLVSHLRHGAPLPRPWVFAEQWSSDRRTQALIQGCQKWISDLDQGWQAEFDVCSDPAERIARPSDGKRLGQVVDTEVDAYRSWRVGRAISMGR